MAVSPQLANTFHSSIIGDGALIGRRIVTALGKQELGARSQESVGAKRKSQGRSVLIAFLFSLASLAFVAAAYEK
jgi:hypothetical protein